MERTHKQWSGPQRSLWTKPGLEMKDCEGTLTLMGWDELTMQGRVNAEESSPWARSYSTVVYTSHGGKRRARREIWPGS